MFPHPDLPYCRVVFDVYAIRPSIPPSQLAGSLNSFNDDGSFMARFLSLKQGRHQQQQQQAVEEVEMDPQVGLGAG